MVINEYIKKTREKNGFSQRQLALYSGVSNATISRIENEGVLPDADTIYKLAKGFKIDPSPMLKMCGYMPDDSEIMPGTWIPVLGRVQAGIPIEAVEEILGYEEISKEMAAHGEYFALQIKGHSMEPKFSESDVVIVLKQSDVESGEIAVVLVNGQDATVKKLVKHENGLSLVPLNPAFEPFYYTSEEIEKMPVSVLGKVVELRAKF